MVDTGRITTADELLAMPRDGRRYELVRGELRTMSPAGGMHGRLVAELAWRLHQAVRDSGAGLVLAGDPGFHIERDPDTVRAPDVAYVAEPRASSWRRDPRFLPGAPDLAIEVVSPSDPYSEVLEKALDWLHAGTRVVLVVDPRRCEATVYRAADDVRVLGSTEVVDLREVVPDLELPLAELFAEPPGPTPPRV
ncbi:MAG: Uma2 family endonuclease [Planctomycetes bacterium]|nr:Uma2 family endonuclease [Planctomycetota bacterium]